MKQGLVIFFACWGMGNMACADELLPWKVEKIPIAKPGMHSLTIDGRIVSFEVPLALPTKSFRAAEVITRGEKFDDWLKKNGEYTKDCFGLDWGFSLLGIPILGRHGFMHIQAKLYIKTSPENRDSAALRDAVLFNNLPGNLDRGDFSKPEEMEALLRRYNDLDKRHSTPVDQVIINNRKWYRYYDNSSLYPDDLREYYVTGLAPDRYLKVTIRLYPTPVSENRYPTSPSEEQRPGWMKKAFKYKEQVISSLRISIPEGSKESDLYDVE